jgi:hypothetical protein
MKPSIYLPAGWPLAMTPCVFVDCLAAAARSQEITG